MRRILRNIITIAALQLPLIAYPEQVTEGGVVDSSLYRELSAIDSETLINKADNYIALDTLLDRAAIALTVVANRYYEHPNDTNARRNAAHALTSLGNFYHSTPIDFRKSYKYLMTARQIAEEDGNYGQLAYIYLSLCNLYHNSDLNVKMSAKAREFMEKGMEAALRSEDTYTMSVIALGMTTSAFNEDSWGNFRESINKFKDYAAKTEFTESKFFIDMIDACDAFLAGDYGRSESILKSGKTYIKNQFIQGKIYDLNTDALLCILYRKKGDNDKAVTICKSIIDKAEEYHLPMYVMSTYSDLHDIYKESGKQDSAEYYYGKFLFAKDSLENGTGFRGVEKMEFLSEIDAINNEVEHLSLKRQEEKRARLLIVSVLIVVVVVLLALIWVHINLKRNHRNLFERNEEMVRLAAQHKLLHEQWEEERMTMASEIKTLKAKSAESVGVAKPENSDDVEVSDMETLKRIYARVLAYMESSKTIFEPGFSMHELAKMVKASVKNVSKAINTRHHGNFHQLLNEFRIREVMRIISSGEADNLTVEGISEKAGFRSRTSFSSLFKRTTGLTPTEYIKMARGNTKSGE